MEEQATVAFEASVEFVGRWQRLVSTTNWEKGRIISEWSPGPVRRRRAGGQLYRRGMEPASRQRHPAARRSAPPRLPTVWRRLRAIFRTLLEPLFRRSGLARRRNVPRSAVQSRWSVPDMRRQRWEASGGPAESAPADTEAAPFEIDEDAGECPDGFVPPTISDSFDEVHAAGPAGETPTGAAPSPTMPTPRPTRPRLLACPAIRWSVRSRPCPSCRPTWPRRWNCSNWPFSPTRSPAGAKSPARTSWPCSTRSASWPWHRRNESGQWSVVSGPFFVCSLSVVSDARYARSPTSNN